jgi:hypothetical protein
MEILYRQYSSFKLRQTRRFTSGVHLSFCEGGLNVDTRHSHSLCYLTYHWQEGRILYFLEGLGELFAGQTRRHFFERSRLLNIWLLYLFQETDEGSHWQSKTGINTETENGLFVYC